MANRKEDRERRRTGGCNTPPVNPPAFIPPKSRPTPKCDPVIEPLEQEYFTPVPSTPEPPADLLIPEALLIGNDQLTLSCADLENVGPEGEPVTIPRDSFQEPFFFASLVELTAAQLNYIASLEESDLQALVPKNISASTIASELKLNSTQGTIVRAAFDAAIDDVNAQALESATATITCLWWNTEQTATCPEDALLEAPENAPSSVQNPSVVAEGTVSSSISQEDADQQALILAQSELQCLWGNDEIILTCQDLGLDEAVPNDNDEIFPGIGLRVGTVVIPANTLLSTDSKNDADNQALILAQETLNCFYINEAVTISCADIGKIGVELIGVGNAVDGTTGHIVTVPEGFVVSSISSEDAQTSAESLAESLLVCQWINDAMEKTCPAAVIYPGTPDEETVYPSPSLSPNYQASVAAGTFTSEISKEDANERAQLLLDGELQCVYCNNQILPLCIPEGLLIEPPIPESLVDENWSLDATLGLAAGTFCGPVPEDVVVIADTVGNLPVRIQPDGDNCLYGNSEVVVACVEEEGVTGLFTSTTGADLSPNSKPNPFAELPGARQVTIAANTVTVRADDVPVGFQPTDPNRNKNYANAIALQQGLSFLDCFFENDATIYTCELNQGKNGVSPNSKDNVEVTAGTFRSNVSKEEAQLQADALGLTLLDCFFDNEETLFTCAVHQEKLDVSPNSNDHILVAAGTFTSYISQVEANTQAAALGLASLNCFYESAAILVTCEDDLGLTNVSTKSRNNISIPQGAFISYSSQEEADLEARAIGLASLNCFYENQRLRVHCATGANDGSYNPVPDVQGDTVVYGNGTMHRIGAYASYGLATVHYRSNGSTTNPVGVPEGRFTSTVSQEEANTIALEFAKGQLNCIFKNPQITILCGASAGDLIPENGGSEFGTGAIGTPVHESATGSVSNPVVIGADEFISFESPEAATRQALLQGIALLDCFWKNVAKESECFQDPVTHILHPTATGFILVNENFIQSYVSQADADNQAKQIIDAQLRCIYGNPENITKDECPDDMDLLKPGTVAAMAITSFASSLHAIALAEAMAEGFMVCEPEDGGQPGNDGPQTGCTSNCFGFYA